MIWRSEARTGTRLANTSSSPLAGDRILLAVAENRSTAPTETSGKKGHRVCAKTLAGLMLSG